MTRSTVLMLKAHYSKKFLFEKTKTFIEIHIFMIVLLIVLQDILLIRIATS